MNYKIEIKDNIRYIVVPRLQELGIRHCFTTKDMDIGVSTNTSVESIKKNIDKVFNFLDIKPTILYSGYQTHSRNIVLIDNEIQGNKYDFGRFFDDTDGLITNKENIATITRFADCTPIILFDQNKRVIANIHSGWKGTLQKIGSIGVQMLIDNYNTDPKDIVAVIGPTIGRYDFEVDCDVAEMFREEFRYMKDIIIRKNDKKSLIDLQTINKNLLLEKGILEGNIEVIDLSTVGSDFLHSFRRDKKDYGLMGSIVVL